MAGLITPEELRTIANTQGGYYWHKALLQAADALEAKDHQLEFAAKAGLLWHGHEPTTDGLAAALRAIYYVATDAENCEDPRGLLDSCRQIAKMVLEAMKGIVPTANESPTQPPLWRVGRKIPRNIYRGDEPIAMVATEELAREIVDGMNRSIKERA